jgi:predicted MFS family arabinose efflux permease
LSSRYKLYALSVVTTVYTLGFLDQGLINLFVQPIEDDLKLNDSEMGFVTGLAFAIFFATMGVPFAQWADRYNRSSIASLAIGLWGATVMVCVFVSNYVQLVAARMLASVGGAGCMPPTYSLVGDLFPSAAARTRAMAIYMLANPVSVLVSYAVGGLLGQRYGWRLTFFAIGLPGLLAAVLVKATVPDPRPPLSRDDPSPAGMTEALRTLWHQRSCRHLSIALILFTTVVQGVAPWQAAFMMRNHGMGTAEVGIALGLIYGFAGAAGMLLGGDVVARWFGEDERAQMRISAGVVALLMPCTGAFLLLPQKYEALGALIPWVVLASFIFGPSFALMQRLVPDQVRATSVAVLLLFSNLIGMGLGPQVIGLLSDALRLVLGIDSLRYAMLAESSLAVLAAYYFWRAGQTVKRDLASVTAHSTI